MMAFAYGSRAFYPGMHYGFGGFGHVFGFLTLVAIVVALVVLASHAARHRRLVAAGVASGSAPAAPDAGDSAIEIARGRLARGEIDADQYVRIVDALTRTPR